MRRTLSHMQLTLSHVRQNAKSHTEESMTHTEYGVDRFIDAFLQLKPRRNRNAIKRTKQKRA